MTLLDTLIITTTTTHKTTFTTNNDESEMKVTVSITNSNDINQQQPNENIII